MSAETILCWVMLIPGLSALVIGVTQNWWVLSVGVFFFPFSMGFTLPALLSTISHHGKSDEQGMLLGKAQSIQALMTVIVTISGGLLLGTSQYMTTIVGGVAMLIAWMIFFIFKVKAPDSLES